jgi:hypothetical protein
MFCSASLRIILTKAFSLIFIGSVLMTALLSGCKKDKDDGNFPTCLMFLIREEEKTCGDIEIFKYNYNNQLVYRFIPIYCRDLNETIYDSKCKYLCSRGGWGGGDGQCTGFYQNAIELELIYRSP